MELDHEVTVPVPVEQAWPVLLDVERLAPCIPGASLDSIHGDEVTGRLRIKVSSVSITYRGTAVFTRKDEQTHAVTIEGSGNEARGSGTASATIAAQLHPEGAATRVTARTSLRVTGRAELFGADTLAEVAYRLVGQFADRLAEQLSDTWTEPPAPAASAGASGQHSPNGHPPGGSRRQPPSSLSMSRAVNPLDAAQAGRTVLSRALPVAGGVVAFVLVVVARRKRGR